MANGVRKSSFRVTTFSDYTRYFVQNQLVAHPQVKLQVVHRNTDVYTPSESSLSARLQKVCQDLVEITHLIEEEISPDQVSPLTPAKQDLPC